MLWIYSVVNEKSSLDWLECESKDYKSLLPSSTALFDLSYIVNKNSEIWNPTDRFVSNEIFWDK